MRLSADEITVQYQKHFAQQLKSLQVGIVSRAISFTPCITWHEWVTWHCTAQIRPVGECGKVPLGCLLGRPNQQKYTLLEVGVEFDQRGEGCRSALRFLGRQALPPSAVCLPGHSPKQAKKKSFSGCPKQFQICRCNLLFV